jgi:hypothetical protein
LELPVKERQLLGYVQRLSYVNDALQQRFSVAFERYSQ